MNGSTLDTLIDEVNGGASIGATLKFQLANLAKAAIEQRRPWMVLRKTDTSKTVTTSNTWQTAINLSTIANFSRFYGDDPIQLFDGNNRVERFRQVPFNMRLSYKDTSHTFVYDEANKLLYLNGTVPFAGTLYIDHLISSPDITSASDPVWVFPSWSHALLAFFAVAIHKGGVDYDDINMRMAPENRATAELLIKQLEGWDNELQLASVANTDPYEGSSGYRSGAININA